MKRTNQQKRKHENTNPDPKPQPNKKPKVDNKEKKDSENDSDSDLPRMPMFFRIILNAPPDGNNPNSNQNQSPKVPEPLACKNPLCDHKTFEENPEPVAISNIQQISHINDLIEIGKTYHCKKNQEYAGMNLRLLCNLIAPLTELNRMIGMESVKEQVISQILFFLQGHHVSNKCNKCTECALNMKCLRSQTEMLHTVITGSPGVGKTELGQILAKLYKEMGILSKGTFRIVSRADLIDKYLGHTAIKTKKVIEECRGGVLFIDEAYALGNPEGRDSFSKECIDTLNQCLSEIRDFLCIIAGYEEDLEKCFFNYNSGLKRRFTFKYNINPYTIEQLLKIFELKVQLSEWKLCYESKEGDSSEVCKTKKQYRNDIVKLFKNHENSFPNYGGDMETLLLNCKIIHSKRCIFSTNEQRELSVDDIKNGIKNFVGHRNGSKNKFTLNVY